MTVALPESHNTTFPTATATAGKWKDDLFSCFRYGFLHPSLWCAVCQPCGMAQVMTRLKLDWRGHPARGDEWRDTFRIIVTITMIFALLGVFLETAAALGNIFFELASDILYLGFLIYVMVVLSRVRRMVRFTYMIPEGNGCKGCDDCCNAFWCSCCTTAQLARQTVDYEKETAQCCSKTGLADHSGYGGLSTAQMTDTAESVPPPETFEPVTGTGTVV